MLVVRRGRDQRARADARSEYEGDSGGVLAARHRLRRSASTFVTAQSAWRRTRVHGKAPLRARRHPRLRAADPSVPRLARGETRAVSGGRPAFVCARAFRVGANLLTPSVRLQQSEGRASGGRFSGEGATRGSRAASADVVSGHQSSFLGGRRGTLRSSDSFRGEPAVSCPMKAAARRLRSASRDSACASSGRCTRPAERGETAECVALRKRTRRHLRRPAAANAIVRPALGRDDPRDSDVAVEIAPRLPSPEAKGIVGEMHGFRALGGRTRIRGEGSS